jgi:hypothetical protein
MIGRGQDTLPVAIEDLYETAFRRCVLEIGELGFRIAIRGLKHFHEPVGPVR